MKITKGFIPYLLVGGCIVGGVIYGLSNLSLAAFVVIVVLFVLLS